MTGLTIVLTAPDPAKLRAALTLLMAQAALGGRATLYLDEAAVPLAAGPADPAGDAARRGHGLPALADLWAEALAMPVAVRLCQTGLALAGMTAETLDHRLEVTGPVAMLAGLSEDRLAIL